MWVEAWKDKHVVPWQCPACNSLIRHGKPTCTSCGKRAPKGANLKLEDEAATRIQCFIRNWLSRNELFARCRQLLCRNFDVVEGNDVFVYNRGGGKVGDPTPWFVLKANLAENHEYRKNKSEWEAKELQLRELEKAREERRKAREDQRELLIVQENEKREKELEELWRPILNQANETKELLACWKGFNVIPPEVEEAAPTMKILRLVGNPFGTISDSFPSKLTNLVVLSFSTCGLTTIPDSICLLDQLVELNLMKNELVSLPENIGNLINLERFFISSNQLKSLPSSIKNLRNIPKLDLERNSIKSLPGDIVEMHTKTMSWSQITLRSLPHRLGDFQFLVSLTANHNRIKRIPTSIGELATLEHLSLCNNLITVIPDRICDCRNLRRLWLDWNKIHALPGNFLDLEDLVSLHLEGNAMRFPEMDLVVQGVPAVRGWFAAQLESASEHEYAAIIKLVQRALADCLRLAIVPPSVLRAGFFTEEVGDPANDEYFAVAGGELYSRVIPAWVERMASLAQESKLEESSAAFPYSEEELEEAVARARDAFGPVCVPEKQRVWFRECACQREGVRRVCVPPAEGFMCERAALVVKTVYVKEAERARRESLAREEEEVEIHKQDARAEAEAYAAGPEGSRTFHERAMELATEATEEELRQAHAVKMLAKLRKAKAKADKHRADARSRLEKQRERHVEMLQKREKELVLQLEGLMAKWEKDILRGKVSDIQDELENLPEDAELDYLQVEEEDAEAKFRFQEGAIAAGEGYRQRSEKQRTKEAMNSKRHKQLTSIYERELINDYVVMKMAEAEAGVRRDYRLLRKIMQSWRMLNVRMTFNQWHEYAATRKKWRRKFEQAEQESKELEFHNQVVQKQLQRAEWEKWKRKINEFTDREYWEHCETKEVSLVEPREEDMVYRPPKLEIAVKFAEEARRARRLRRRK